MAGITDLPFRMLNRGFGCELAFVEMINVRSMSYKSKKTRRMLLSDKRDRPLGIQLLGFEEQYIEKALNILKQYEFDILDFNAACPARKVTTRGEGASLMRQPKELHRLLRILVKGTSVPVTLKIRAGWDKDSMNAREVALAAEEAGINGLFIHGRTKQQGYSGRVDYGIIRDIKSALGIPVIASGDVFSGALARRMLDETGCDGLAIARGALGNPWIFQEIAEALKGGASFERPALEEITRVMSAHFNACVDFYGEKKAAAVFRKFFAWYTKGMHSARRLRQKCCRARNRKEVTAIIDELKRL